jgi:hypothetical protein
MDPSTGHTKRGVAQRLPPGKRLAETGDEREVAIERLDAGDGNAAIISQVTGCA